MAAANGLRNVRSPSCSRTYVRRTTAQRIGPAPPRASASSAQEAGAELGPHLVSLRGGRRTAVSYTFDDALRDHSELAAPFLEMFGLKGTFFVCPGQIPDDEQEAASLPPGANGSMGWEALRRMTQHGHEVGSHSMTHPDLVPLHAANPHAVDWELRESARLIEQQVGVAPTSLAYPFNSFDANVHSVAVAAGYAGMREQQVRFGGAGFDAAAADAAVQQAADAAAGEDGGGNWLVAMLHGLKHGYDALDEPSSFMTHLAHVSCRDDVWVAPFGEVLQYKRQREQATLHTERTKGGGYRLRLTISVVAVPTSPACPLFDAPQAGADSSPAAPSTTSPSAAKPPLPMTVAVPAMDPNNEIFFILLDLVPNGPAVLVPPPPSMTLLGQLYMHLL